MSIGAMIHQLNDKNHIDAQIGDQVTWRRGKRRVYGIVEQMISPGTSAAELRPSNVPKSRWNIPKQHGDELYLNDHRILVANEHDGKKTYYVIPTHRIRQFVYQLEVVEKTSCIA